MTFGYSDDKILFRGVDFGVTMESRVALVGANGTGKSTLLKLMTQELTPMAGSVEQNRKLRLGVFNQHFVDQLNLDMTPVEYIQHKFDDCSYENARRYLGSFGLPSMNHEQVRLPATPVLMLCVAGVLALLSSPPSRLPVCPPPLPFLHWNRKLGTRHSAHSLSNLVFESVGVVGDRSFGR